MRQWWTSNPATQIFLGYARLCQCLTGNHGVGNKKLEIKDKIKTEYKIIHHDFVQGQGNPPECQRFAVHDEACRVLDVANLRHEGGFPCPCTKSWLIIFLLPLSIPTTKPHFRYQKRCLVRKRRQLGLIMTSGHCMIYDVTRCSLKRSCLYRGR